MDFVPLISLAVINICYCHLDNSTLIPPTGISLSEDVDTTYSFIFTEYDQNLRVSGVVTRCRSLPEKVGRNWKKVSRVSRESPCIGEVEEGHRGARGQFRTQRPGRTQDRGPIFSRSLESLGCSLVGDFQTFFRLSRETSNPLWSSPYRRLGFE